MIRNFIAFVLRRRLEDVMAVGFSATLLVFFLTTRLFRTFELEGHDFIFILLPVAVLGVKCLLEILSDPDSKTDGDPGAGKFLACFFKPLAKILRDWFPFLLLSACYYALYTNLALRINPQTADGALAEIDASLLGDQASFLLQNFTNPWLTDFFNLVYFSYVFSLPAVALYFYLGKDEKAFRRVMMGYLTLMLMAITSYIIIPATGPEKFFAGRYTHDLQGHAISRNVDYIISVGRVGYDCFPSLHVGIPLLLSLYLLGYQKKLFVPAMIYVAFMCCATIYLRYHYLVDVIAAFAYAPATYWLNDFLLARWPGEQILIKSRNKRNPA